MTDSHEIFPNAPLTMVAVEIRFQGGISVQSLTADTKKSFREILGKKWVVDTQPSQTPTVTIRPGLPMSAISPTTMIQRFTLRDRTVVVAVADQSMTIETTHYEHYPSFREMIQQAVEATAKVITPDGISRVGMRYINEIRVPNTTGNDTLLWQSWIDPSLLAPQLTSMTDTGFGCVGWDGAVQYQTGDDQKLVFRYGPRTVYMSPGSLNKHPIPSLGAMFLLDFDCYWDPADIPEFDLNTIMITCDNLRKPIRVLFDKLITERLYKLFLSKEDKDV